MQATIAKPSASAPVIFNFTEQAVRIVADDHDNPWFAATDICNVLGYTNSSKAIADHCKEAGITKRDISSGGQMRELTFINEGNLYRLIVKSRKPEAEKFEAWLMDEVLPSIRKTGGYAVSPAPTFDPVAFDQAGKALIGMVQTLLPQHSLRQSYQIANAHIKAATGQDVLSVWPIVLAELDDTRPALHVATAGANLSSLPPLPWANKSKKPAVKSRHDKQLERLASYLRHPERIAVYSTTYAVSRDLIADLLAKGYIPRQVLLKVMHVPAAEFNLLIAEGKEAGIVRELDGIEFNYAGMVYVAGGAA